MKKALNLTGILIILGFMSYAKEVTVKIANFDAKNFYYQNIGLLEGISLQNINPTLIYENKYQSETADFNKEYPIYYIFNIDENEGFVIVAADDIVIPILGYSGDGAYDPNIQYAEGVYFTELK